LLQRHNARIRGAFSAITQPTTVRSVSLQFGFLDTLVHTELSRLIDAGELAGMRQGAQERSMFMPMVSDQGCATTVVCVLMKLLWCVITGDQMFAKNQKQTIESFFNQNGYIEYSALSRLQVSASACWSLRSTRIQIDLFARRSRTPPSIWPSSTRED